jgi:hypothetical protein
MHCVRPGANPRPPHTLCPTSREGSKPGDQWVVPLCNTHHRALHDSGNERVWWQNAKIDPLAEAERLWQQAPRSIKEPANISSNSYRPHWRAAYNTRAVNSVPGAASRLDEAHM